MRRILLLVGCLAVAACSHSPTEGGLQVTVHTDADAFVTCVELDVLDSTSTVLGSKQVPLTGHADVIIAIAQKDFPADVTLSAFGLYGQSGCTSALPNSAVTQQPETFTPGVTNVDITVHRPTTADDADADGFTSSAKGGPDCDDTNANVNPAAAESCTEVVDLNCNGKYGCDDPACPPAMCIHPPTTVAFASAAQSTVSLVCSAAIVIELHDGMDMAVPAGANTTVTLAEVGNLSLAFFSDSGCTIPATSADIMKGQKQVRFYARGSAAGTTQLSASAAGVSTATQPFVVSPGAAVGLFFTSAAQSVKADTCSQAVTLTTRDMQSNEAPVTVDTPYTLTPSDATGLTLYADAACMSVLDMPKLASGTSTSTFYFKAVRTPGVITFTVTAPPLTMAMQDETIIAGDPIALVFATAAQTLSAGACSMAMTLKVQDAHGTDTTVASATQLMLMGSPSFFSNASCTTPANAVATIAAAQGSATVYFSATAAGAALVTASGPGLPTVMQTETVNPGAAASLVFQNGIGGIPASTCSPVSTLGTRDAFGNVTNVTGMPLAITLSANPPGGFTFYNGGSCGTATTTLSIPVGQNSVPFNFEGTVAQTVTLTASSTLKPDPTQSITVGVGAVSKLVFLTGPQTLTANACSSAVTLQAQDSSGNIVSALNAIAIPLAASPSTGFTFYSDAGCSTAVTQVGIPIGGSQTSYFFRGTASGMVQMTPTSPPLTAPPPQTATINPAAANSMLFTSPARSITAGTCTQALTLQAHDPFSNVSSVASDTVLMLSGTPTAGLTFFTDATCSTAAVTAVTMTSGTSSVTFYARGNTAPGYTINAQSGTLGTAMQGLVVSPAAANQLVIRTGAQSLNTGTCSAQVTVERQDAFANPVTTGTTPVALSQSPDAGGLLFFSDACSTPASSVNITGASSVNVFFEGTVPGMPTLVASSAGLTPASQKENLNVAPANKVVFINAPQTAVTAGVCSAALTLQSQDSFGNASAVGADTTVTFGAPPAGTSYYADPGCGTVITQTTLSAGTNQVSWYFKGTVALSFTASATATGIATPATQGEGIVPAAFSQLAFTTAARSQPAGACSQKLTVQRQDQFNNPVTTGSTVLTLTTPSAGVTFFSDACATSATTVTIPAAASTVDFYFKGTSPGSPTITASAGVIQTFQTEMVTALTPSKVVFTTPPRSATAGTCSAALTLQAQDTLGNPSGVVSATPVGLSGSAGNMTFYSDMCVTPASTVSIPSGMTDVTFFASGTAVSTPTVTVTPTGLTGTTQGFTLTAAGAAKLVYTTSSQQMGAGQCSALVTVQAQDAYGNVSGVSGATTLTPAASPSSLVTFFQDATCMTALSAGVALVGGDTQGTFYMKGGTVIQGGTVTTSSSPLALTATTPQSETVVAGPAKQLAFTSAAPPNQMAGACSGIVTVQLQDIGGNATTSLTATTVNLSAAPATGFTFYSDNCVTPVTSVSIPSNMSSVDVHVKGITGGAGIVMTAAAAGLTSATQAITILNAVMTGTCAIASGSTSITCSISPALKDTTKTMLMFQAPNNSTSPANSQVRCELTDTATITCTRSGTTGDINVRWYTLALASGLSVQHINGINRTTAAQTVTIPTAVTSVNDTFLLLSSDASLGNYNDRILSTAHLGSTTQVTLTQPSAPSGTEHHSLQVVEWTGATVARGATNIGNNNLSSGNVAVADSTTTPTFLLDTFRWDGAGSTDEICRQSVHGAISNSTTLLFTRASGAGGNCNNAQIDVEYERVSLPAGHRVDSFGDSPAAGADGTTFTLTNGAVDLTRSLAFFSGQGMNGQSAGECANATVDQPRDCTIRASFVDANNLATTRPTVVGSSAGAFSVYMVQVSP